MIKVELRDGMYEEIQLELHGSKWRQRLDYWKIPFRCFSCRQVKHLANECKNSEQRAIQHKNKDKGISRDKKSNDSQPSDRTQEPIMTKGIIQENLGKTALSREQFFSFFLKLGEEANIPLRGQCRRELKHPWIQKPQIES